MKSQYSQPYTLLSPSQVHQIRERLQMLLGKELPLIQRQEIVSQIDLLIENRLNFGEDPEK